ncbi:MAG: pentapeptide repeat-containing protein [Chloroflexi bacterium]|nr:pentapeptide repeat-containing protein [Chloroflexota bacterium]
MRRSNLRGANLRGAYLEGADLRRAYLEEADLEGADLRRAYLLGADLRRAHLKEADLRTANLIGASFDYGSILTTRNWKEAIFSEGIKEQLDQFEKEMAEGHEADDVESGSK